MTIENSFTPSQPLGPIVAEDALEPVSFRVLFDKANTVYANLNHQKCVLIGRKGSGKTTLLNSATLESNAVSVFIKDVAFAPSFAAIVDEISLLSKDVPFVEQTSKLWEFLLWGIAANYIVRTGKGTKELKGFCDELSISTTLEPYEIFHNMLGAIKKYPPEEWPLPQKIAYKRIAGLSMMEVKSIIKEILRASSTRLYILVDSLEDYHFEFYTHVRAIAGLLRCIGEFSSSSDHWVVLRVCMPAEKYFDYMSASSNPLKDFRSTLLLHWKAGELIRLAAHRYKTYLKIHCTDFYNKNLVNNSLETRENVKKFWGLVLPEYITNSKGVQEKSIAYILRHTQLLPRHFLMYMTEILSSSIKGEMKAYEIRETHVVSGVKTQEVLVKQQIIQAYADMGKGIVETCEEILPNLRNVFTRSEFDKVAAKMKKGIVGVEGGTEAIKLLTEIGAIGKLVGETDRYYNGIFEYMVPHQLLYSHDDKFCVHPVFTETFNVGTEYDGYKPVLTYWAGITDEDIADWVD